MLAPDLQFMVHSSEVIDEEGYAHRGSSIALLETGAPEPPQWRSRDFAFAAYGGCHAAGLREVHLGKWSFWAFPAAREHCEEIIIFRRGTDTRRKWNEDSLDQPELGLGMFFVMRASQISAETPLGKQFNGEWGFWESFYVPLLDDEHTMRALSLMDPAMVEDHFVLQRLPVTCHICPPGCKVLTVPDDAYVTYEVKVVCKDLSEWSDLCSKIGDDMRMEDACIVEHKHLKRGDECIDAYTEVQGLEERARLVKRDFEQLKLPVVATFRVTLRVKDWDQDMISLQYKYEFISQMFTSNLMGGFTSLSGAKADPWHPVARLAVNALEKILARFPEIQTVMDVGCGDMSWIRYFLRDHPTLAYVGVDINPYCLAVNFKRFPKLQFVQTDLSNVSAVEVMPQGCDLVIAKDVFNHMTLPDAIAALSRVIRTRPHFLLTHVHAAADNTGWERRIDKHLHYTRYDYNKPPFSLPFPATAVQCISDEAYFVLYEITPESVIEPPPPRTARLRPPVLGERGSYALITEGEYLDPAEAPPAVRAVSSTATAGAHSSAVAGAEARSVASASRAGTFAPEARTRLTAAVTELPDRPVDSKAMPERKPIKGLPPVEFRARCDLIFDYFNGRKREALHFEELSALMLAAGRKVETRQAYEDLCSRMGCEAAAGLSRKDLHRFFEKAPQPVWDEVCRTVDPLAGTARRGAEHLPVMHLERPLTEFLFEDGDPFALVHVELNAHMFYGAAEAVSSETVQAFFAATRMELHVCAPGAFGGKELYRWRLVLNPLAGEIVPDDCTVEVKETTGRFGGKRLTVSLMKAKHRKWYNAGQIGSAVRP